MFRVLIGFLAAITLAAGTSGGVAASVGQTPDQRACRQGFDDRSSNLCATWKAADAAHLSAWTGVWTLVSAAAAAAFAGGALLYTRRSAEASVKAVEEAGRAAKAAEDALKLDRAWMTSGGVEASIIVDDGAEKIQLLHRWVNSGRSPAIDTSCAAETRIVARDDGVEAMTADHSLDVSRSMVGAGAYVHGPCITIGQVATPQILNRELEIHFYNSIEYRDVFDRDIARRTETYFVVYVLRGENGHVVTQSQPRGPQNTIS